MHMGETVKLQALGALQPRTRVRRACDESPEHAAIGSVLAARKKVFAVVQERDTLSSSRWKG